MRYLTARKRAEGKGASHTGTEHHWSMTLSSVALAFMVPTWLYIFGSALGAAQDEVVATFARPFPASRCEYSNSRNSSDSEMRTLLSEPTP